MNTLSQIQCPYCWEELSIELDPQGGQQSFVEDCHVCCRPILITANYLEFFDDYSVSAERESS